MRVVGNIAGYHGLKGEIKIFPLVDDIEVFHDFPFLLINDNNYTIKSWRAHKNFVLVILNEINNLTEAEELQGEVKAELVEELDDNNIYIEDLLNCLVYDQNNKEIGKVVNFSSQGQQLVFVKLNDNFAAKRDLLVPFVDEYILSISDKKDSIVINLTDDLLELSK